MTEVSAQCVWVTAERAVMSLHFQAGASQAICLGHFIKINLLSLKKKRIMEANHLQQTHCMGTSYNYMCNCGMEK